MNIPTPPSAITFDCWSTLITDLDWGATTKARVSHLIRIAANQGVDLDPEKATELLEGSWNEHVQQWRAGRIFGPQGASRWCLEQLSINVTERVADELAEAIEGATSEVGTAVVAGAAEAVDSVREAGIATALICDTGFTPGRWVRLFLNEHSISLDHYFFSEEVGSPKPYPPIFSAALAATQARPAESIHIGDLKRTDIAGGRLAGMATIRFAGVHDDGWNAEEVTGEEADAVLYHWKELNNLIGI